MLLPRVALKLPLKQNQNEKNRERLAIEQSLVAAETLLGAMH